jgi:hypothetical protein
VTRIRRNGRSINGVPPTLSLPHRPAHAPAHPLRAATPGALLGALAGAIAGLLAGGVLTAVVLALAGALLVVALVAAVPDHRGPERPERPRHPAAEPTTTLAVPPPGPDAPPGWYPDPDPDPSGGAPDVRRLWDGEAWTEHRWAPRA